MEVQQKFNHIRFIVVKTTENFSIVWRTADIVSTNAAIAQEVIFWW